MLRLFPRKELQHERKKEASYKTVIRTSIEEPKMEAGKRIIPMTDDVYQCFKTIIENGPTAFDIIDIPQYTLYAKYLI